MFSITTPDLIESPWPDGIFIPTRDSDGNALYTQITMAELVDDVCTVTETALVIDPINPNPPSCLESANNTALGSSVAPFREVFYGNSAKPRVAVGAGVNWNSPFGPFRLDFAHVLLKEEGDDTKSFTFNVGTQF